MEVIKAKDGIIEQELDKAYEAGTNVVFIGPAIGKTSRVKEWAEKNDLNGYFCLPYPFIEPYMDEDLFAEGEDATKGILVLDANLPYEVENKLVPLMNDILAGKSMAGLFSKIPNICMNVIILSSYEDCQEANQKVLEMVNNKPDWKVVELDYDKREQLPFFIEKASIVAKLYEKTDQSDIDEYEKEKRNPVYMEHPEWLLSPEEKCKASTKKVYLLQHLLDSPYFDTKGDDRKKQGLNNFELARIMADWKHGSKAELLALLGENCYYEDVKKALSDYFDE